MFVMRLSFSLGITFGNPSLTRIHLFYSIARFMVGSRNRYGHDQQPANGRPENSSINILVCSETPIFRHSHGTKKQSISGWRAAVYRQKNYLYSPLSRLSFGTQLLSRLVVGWLNMRKIWLESLLVCDTTLAEEKSFRVYKNCTHSHRQPHESFHTAIHKEATQDKILDFALSFGQY